MLFLRRGQRGIVQQWCRVLHAVGTNDLASPTHNVQTPWSCTANAPASNTTRLEFAGLADLTNPHVCHHRSHWGRSYSKKAKKHAAGADTSPADDTPWHEADTKQAMNKAIEHLQHEYHNLRTGRATPGMFDHIKADVYGERMPIKAVGTSSVRDAHLAVVTVYDPDNADAVAKAIRESPLGLDPQVEGAEVLVRIPRPTKETVAGLMKMAKAEAEGAKVTVRHARKLAMDEIKAMASEDLRRKAEKQVQTITDEYIHKVDAMLKDKDRELAALV